MGLITLKFTKKVFKFESLQPKVVQNGRRLQNFEYIRVEMIPGLNSDTKALSFTQIAEFKDEETIEIDINFE